MKSDYSLFSLFTAGLACMVPLTSAYTKPTGSGPKGNPISQPGLNSLVPAGHTFAVTWQPTTQGTVTLVLLKGPSSDAEPLGVIAEGIKNSGTYIWHVSPEIEPSAHNQPEGYGIQLIDDETGQYQYTTQFGITNPSYKPGDSWGSLSSVSSSSGSSSTAKSSQTHTSQHHSGATTTAHHSTGNTTSTGTASTGWHHTSTVSPTGSMTVPVTLRSTVASTGLPTRTSSVPTTTPTNGASGSFASSFVGLVFAAGVAVFTL